MHNYSIHEQAYDYLLTLHYEVRCQEWGGLFKLSYAAPGLQTKLIWPWKWGLGKVLYLLTRYLPFIDITIFLICETF